MSASDFRFYTVAELAELPEMEPLIDGLLYDGQYSAIVAPSGLGKSFLALSMAFSVATGREFFGRRVKRGPVIYVAPEGFRGLFSRIQALMAVHGCNDVPDLHVLRDAAYLHDGASVAALVAAIHDRLGNAQPALIQLDTLAKCSVGMDENSNSDRELTNTGVAYIQRHTGAHVMVLHHTGHNERRERGGSSLKGGLDTMLFLERADDGFKMTVAKQRDGADGLELRFSLTPYGDSQIVTQPQAEHVGQAEAKPKFTKTARKALEALARISTSDGVTCADWKASADLPPSTFFAARKDLVVLGYAKAVHGGRYTVSPEGLEKLQLQNHSKNTPTRVGKPLHSNSTTPLRGWSSGAPGQSRSEPAA